MCKIYKCEKVPTHTETERCLEWRAKRRTCYGRVFFWFRQDCPVKDMFPMRAEACIDCVSAYHRSPEAKWLKREEAERMRWSQRESERERANRRFEDQARDQSLGPGPIQGLPPIQSQPPTPSLPISPQLPKRPSEDSPYPPSEPPVQSLPASPGPSGGPPHGSPARKGRSALPVPKSRSSLPVPDRCSLTSSQGKSARQVSRAPSRAWVEEHELEDVPLT